MFQAKISLLFLLFVVQLMAENPQSPQITLNFINESDVNVKVLIRELFNEFRGDDQQIVYHSQNLKEIDVVEETKASATFLLLQSDHVGINTPGGYLKPSERYLRIDLIASEGQPNWIPLRFGTDKEQIFTFTFKLRKSSVVPGRIEAIEISSFN